MLIQIRERASGIVAYIIVILISIPFALWGIHEYFGGPSDRNVAEINGAEITKRIFDNQLQQQRRRLKSLLGDSYEAMYADESQLKKSVLDNLIENTLLVDETRSAGYHISNTQLFERIKSVPQFQIDGQFSNQRYEQLLSSQRRNKVEFEEQLREEERISQYQSSITYSSFLPGNDKTNLAILKRQKRSFDYFIVYELFDLADITQDEITTYYNENTDNFKSPAQVKLEYIELKQQEIGDSLEFSEDELLVSYEDEPDRYRTPELRKAKHILFKLDENSPAEDVEAAFARANKLVERLGKGEQFATLAKEYSEDKVSAKNGGDLGFLSRTDIDNPVFVDKLFSMQVGQISDPVKTLQGVQIIQLDEITPSELKPFEQVRVQVEGELRSQIADREFVKQAERLQELSYENEDTLTVAADNLNKTVKTSDWVSGVESEGIVSHPKVINAAFSDDVLTQRYNSELLEIGDGHVVVVRVVEHQEAAIQSLEEVTESIKSILNLRKSVEASLAKGKNLLTSLRTGDGSMEDIAKVNNFKLEAKKDLSREDASVPAEVLSRVFKLPKIQSDQPEYDGFQMGDGKYAVIRLTSVTEPDGDEAKIEGAEWITAQGKYGRREMTAMLKALRESSDVQIFSDQL